MSYDLLLNLATLTGDRFAAYFNERMAKATIFECNCDRSKGRTRHSPQRAQDFPGGRRKCVRS